MTLSTTVSRVSYPGAGSTGPFAIPFRFFGSGANPNTAPDLLVTKRSSLAIETVLVVATDYTVTGAGDATGTLTLTVALAVGETLHIRRKPALTQPMSIRNQGAYFPATIEDEDDRLVMQLQSLQDSLDRCVKLKETVPGSASLVELEPTNGYAVTGTGSGFTMSPISAGAVALPGNGRTTTTLSAYLGNNAVVNVLDFAPVGVTINTGVASASSAFALMLAAMRTGKYLGFVPDGDYLVGSELTLDVDYMRLIGASRRTRLLANANNLVLIRVAASHCEVSDFLLDGNSKTGITLLGVVPVNEVSQIVGSAVQQNYNVFRDLYFGGGADEAIRMRPGNAVGGGASGCWYNEFYNMHVTYCKRGLWMQTAAFSTAGTSGNNANKFYGFAVVDGTMLNTGIQIDDGRSNKFFGPRFEGVAAGVTPNAIPTALKITAVGVSSGLANDSNIFSMPGWENNTRDTQIDAGSTEIHGADGIAAAKCFGTWPFGGTSVAGNPSQIPFQAGPFDYGEGIAGHPSGRVGCNKPMDITGDLTTTLGITAAGALGLKATTGPVTFNNAQLLNQLTAAVSVAADILTIPAAYQGGAHKIIVWGTTGALGFMDEVALAPGFAPVVLHSSNLFGVTPAVRTYTSPGVGSLKLAMASGTYRINCTAIMQN